MSQKVKKKDLFIFSFIWMLLFSFFSIYILIVKKEINYLTFTISFVFLFLGIIQPNFLNKIYFFWIKIGDLIGGVISKVILFILFFLVFTPISFFLRILGKDFLNKKIIKNQSSYWIERTSQPESMKNQF
tara:strand:+ start:300 stop:689 length:390 start_codon:yes stop_codon:yes gene_type:complete